MRSGLTELALITILVVVVIRWVARKLHLPRPAAYGISVVFVLVTLTLWAEHFNQHS
jgi:hypothetical protein